jgi:hypothetical protein
VTPLDGQVAVVTGGHRGIGRAWPRAWRPQADPALVFHTGDSIVIDGG